MFLRHFSYEFAILAILCIAAIFLFPVIQGPYSAVHGPVTALLSIKARLLMWLALALTALLVGCRLFARARGFCFKPREGLTFGASPFQHTPVLRC
jgi:hypothetical protein